MKHGVLQPRTSQNGKLANAGVNGRSADHLGLTRFREYGLLPDHAALETADAGISADLS